MAPTPAPATSAPAAAVPPDLLEVAGALVAAFAAGDLEAYFASFAEDAVFVFHGTDRVLTSVAEYRALWQEWVDADGFAVQECTTSEQLWQHWPGAAVLVHRVATTATAAGEVQRSDERETIVFARREGRWVAVHEHLSLHP